MCELRSRSDFGATEFEYHLLCVYYSRPCLPNFLPNWGENWEELTGSGQ